MVSCELGRFLSVSPEIPWQFWVVSLVILHCNFCDNLRVGIFAIFTVIVGVYLRLFAIFTVIVGVYLRLFGFYMRLRVVFMAVVSGLRMRYVAVFYKFKI